MPRVPIQQTHQLPFRQVGDNQTGYSDDKKSGKPVDAGFPLSRFYSLSPVISGEDGVAPAIDILFLIAFHWSSACQERIR